MKKILLAVLFVAFATLCATAQGWNGYAYGTDPLNQVDPSGLVIIQPSWYLGFPNWGGADPGFGAFGLLLGSPSDFGTVPADINFDWNAYYRQSLQMADEALSDQSVTDTINNNDARVAASEESPLDAIGAYGGQYSLSFSVGSSFPAGCTTGKCVFSYSGGTLNGILNGVPYFLGSANQQASMVPITVGFSYYAPGQSAVWGNQYVSMGSDLYGGLDGIVNTSSPGAISYSVAFNEAGQPLETWEAVMFPSHVAYTQIWFEGLDEVFTGYVNPDGSYYYYFNP